RPWARRASRSSPRKRRRRGGRRGPGRAWGADAWGLFLGFVGAASTKGSGASRALPVACADKTPPATGVDMTAAPTYEDVRWSVLLANAGNVSYEGVRVTIDVTPLSSGVTAHDEKTV